LANVANVAKGASMESQYLTPSEVAMTLRVTPEAVQAWCRSGKLHAIRAGKRWRITQSAIDAFVRSEVQQEAEQQQGLAACAS